MAKRITDKQSYVIFCLTGWDLRLCDIEPSEALEIIKAVKLGVPVDFSKYERAVQRRELKDGWQKKPINRKKLTW
jgi:hypothetical protein